MDLIVRITVTDLRSGSEEAVCHGLFHDRQEAREFAWKELRRTVSEAVKGRSARSCGIPGQMDLFSVFTQDYLAGDSAYRVVSSVERLELVEGETKQQTQMDLL